MVVKKQKEKQADESSKREPAKKKPVKASNRVAKRLKAEVDSETLNRLKKGPGRPRTHLRPDEEERIEKLKAEKPFLTLTDVIELLQISTVTAQRWLREGRFVGFRWGGNQWLFDKDFKIREGKRSGLNREIYSRLVPENFKERVGA